MTMVSLSGEQAAGLRGWFEPEQPGPLVGPHVRNTGHGQVWADGWPAPRALLAETTDNYALRGDPAAWDVAQLRARLHGFVEASAEYAPLLRAINPALVVWPRVVYALDGPPPDKPKRPRRSRVRALQPGDAPALAGLSAEVSWAFKTWGGAAGALAGGTLWGAWLDGRLASVAGTFYRGDVYEDLCVATEPAFQGLGLSTACAAGLCAAIVARGRQPSWNTSTDNAASRRVAEKLGFRWVRDDCLYVIGVEFGGR